MTLDFSADVPEQDSNFELIPKGTLARCLVSLKYTDDGNAIHISSTGKEMLSLELEIIDGKYAGRKLWDYVVEPTKQREWGWNKVKSILSVANANKPEDARYVLTGWDDLNGAMCAVEVGIQKSKDPQYSDKNTPRYLRNDPASPTYDKYQKLVGGGTQTSAAGKDDKAPF